MADLDLTALRLSVTTPLTDPALEVLLNAAIADVTRASGGDSKREFLRQPRGPLAVLSAPVGEVTTLKEAGSLLAASDYLLTGTHTLRRMDDGANPASTWLGELDVLYVPGYSQAERDRVVILLVKHDLNFAPGLTGQSIAQWSEQYSQQSAMFATERSDILATLGGGSLSAPILY